MPNSIETEILPREIFRRVDETADERFYDSPRFVAHIDNRAIAFVTEVYREFFPERGAILDLMSSWISHLPPEIAFEPVAGLGMNREELEANPRLTERKVQNLNANPILPFAENEFDAAGVCVSVQYLTEPVKVFGEIARVLKKGASLVVTFSNRCFPTKAVYGWNALDDTGHIELVREYFAASGGFGEPETRRHLPRGGDPLFAVIARKR